MDDVVTKSDNKLFYFFAAGNRCEIALVKIEYQLLAKKIFFVWIGII